MSNNQNIRKALRLNGVCLWQVGNALGVSESTMTRMMRTEIPDEKELEILEAIRKIREERDADDTIPF